MRFRLLARAYAVTLTFLSVFVGVIAIAQDQSTKLNSADSVRPGDNLSVENIPPIPASVAEKANRYGEFLTASLPTQHHFGQTCKTSADLVAYATCAATSTLQ